MTPYLHGHKIKYNVMLSNLDCLATQNPLTTRPQPSLLFVYVSVMFLVMVKAESYQIFKMVKTNIISAELYMDIHICYGIQMSYPQRSTQNIL